MKHKALLLLSMSFLLASSGAHHALAQTSNRTVIMYQGLAKQDGVPANGPVDMTWRIYDAETNGNLIAQGQVSQVQVQDGLFTLPMDLPSLSDNALPPPDGSPTGTWWMELCLRFPSLPSCRLMSPRQRITPTVQALSARVASTVRDGAVTAAKLASGAVNTSSLQNGAVTGGKIADGNVIRSLNGLKDQVTLSPDDGIMINTIGNDIRIAATRSCSDYTNCYWNLLGNGNVTENVNFLGTIVDVALDLRVNNRRAMRYDFTAPGTAPNIIGGYAGNIVNGTGGTISGGGEATGVNIVAASWGTIGGGRTNVVIGTGGTISGGENNFIQINSPDATISGGTRNLIQANAHYSTIGGGGVNTISNDARQATISGGQGNVIGTFADGTTVAGGEQNSVLFNADQSTIGGGWSNRIEQTTTRATIGGGHGNIIQSTAPNATVPGGREALASNYGQQVYASGLFAAPGDAQSSLYVLRRSITAGATNELFLDGDAATRRMNLRPESTWTFDILVVGRTDGGTSAGYGITGVIRRPNLGPISFVGAPTTTPFGNNMAGGSVFVEADAVNNALVIKAVSHFTASTRWVATVRTSEVIY